MTPRRGQPGRPRRLPLGARRGLRELDKSASYLERHHNLRMRRPPFGLVQSDDTAALDHLERRIVALEKNLV